jgi:hypothetical protein
MFFGYGPEISYQAATVSGVVNDSGKPQALYRVTFKSGGTAGTITFFDGTSSLGTYVYDITGTISSTVVDNPGFGLVFPKGLYVSLDGNVSKYATWSRQVQNV